MIDVISGGRLIAGFPVGSPMDTCFAYGQNPSMLRERYLEAHDLVVQGLDRAGHLRVQRPLQPAALRQHLAAPGAEAAPADLDTRAAARSRPGSWCAQMDHVYCYLSLLRLQGRAGDDGRLLGRDGPARQGPEPVPRRLPAIRRRRREPRGGATSSTASRPNISTAAACTSTRASPVPPGYTTEATQRARHPGPGAAGRRASLDAASSKFADAGARDGRDRRARAT